MCKSVLAPSCDGRSRNWVVGVTKVYSLIPSETGPAESNVRGNKFWLTTETLGLFVGHKKT